MKVLVANKFFFRNGGSEVVMFQEREFLQENGVEVVDFSMADPRNLESEFSSYFVGNSDYRGTGGVWGRIRSAAKLVHSREAVQSLSRLIQDVRPDLVHCHIIYHQLTPSIIGAAARLHLPVVLTLHDYKPVCPVYTRVRGGRPCSDCAGGRFYNVLRHRCADGSTTKSAVLFAEAYVQQLMGSYEKLSAVIAPSRFMANSVSPDRFPTGKVKLLYNGVDTDIIKGSDEDCDFILYFGRLSNEKGIETLLAAHQRMKMPQRLVVAGTGPLEDQLRGQYPDVEFVGHILGQRLARMLQQCSIVVVPSEWYENCPMSVLEAMAYGKPVVGSDIGGVPELVQHGETGLLFAPGNVQALETCMWRLMGDKKLRAQLGKAARNRAVEMFSLRRHNRELLKIYDSAMNSCVSKEAIRWT